MRAATLTASDQQTNNRNITELLPLIGYLIKSHYTIPILSAAVQLLYLQNAQLFNLKLQITTHRLRLIHRAGASKRKFGMFT